MSSITVTSMEPGWFGVQVTEGDLVTGHRVSVEPEALERLGAAARVEPETLVREAVAFCLDRMTANELPEPLSLQDLLTRYPEFAAEMGARTA